MVSVWWRSGEVKERRLKDWRGRGLGRRRVEEWRGRGIEEGRRARVEE